MDGRVLGDMPSEGSEGGRRFGIYSSYSPDPKVYSISRIRLAFVIAIVIVVSFAVIFPMVQYASRARKNLQSLPYPEIANISISDEKAIKPTTISCSTNVFSFGLDCSESPTVGITTENKVPQTGKEVFDGVKIVEGSENMQNSESTTEIYFNSDVNTVKYDRMGRSGWPVASTPYPYLGIPKPTPAVVADDRTGFFLPEQTNIFAIPANMNTESFSEYQKPRINFTPPPYAFTPFPNFTDSYAQLSPYKIPKNYTNFEEILKFLNKKEDLKIVESENTERILTSRNPMMKVTGTYVMPLDRRRPGEIVVSSSQNNEEARPFFNGHAYVTDPFLKFRPANPSEINRLIPIKSGLDIGPRFRKPVSFLPSASVPIDLYAPAPLPDDYSTAGSHTVAIFHPPPSLVNSPRPTSPPPQDKPLSVTLDIYPVTVEASPPEGMSVSPPTPGRVRGRLDPKWRPKPTERPRWRPHVPRRPSTLGGAKSADNHMVVHLNLFPNKRKQYTFPRRGRQESTTPGQTSALLSGGQFGSRSDQDMTKEDNSSAENRGTTDSTSTTRTEQSDQPEYSALGGFTVEEVYSTTPLHEADTTQGPEADSDGSENFTPEGGNESVEDQEQEYIESRTFAVTESISDNGVADIQ